MSDDWNWDDGHADPGDHPDDLGFDHADTDPFGVDLGGDDLGVGAGEELPGHEDVHGWDDDGGVDDGDAGDPFAPDALVGEQHDWAAGLDDGPDGGEDALAAPLDATGLFGADPDVSAYTDALWPTPEFPAALDLGDVLPEPVDGPPWTDPAALGTLEPSELLPSDHAPEPGDLAAYAGLDPAASGWEALAGSEDPATAALARFWGPAQG